MRLNNLKLALKYKKKFDTIKITEIKILWLL